MYLITRCLWPDPEYRPDNPTKVNKDRRSKIRDRKPVQKKTESNPRSNQATAHLQPPPFTAEWWRQDRGNREMMGQGKEERRTKEARKEDGGGGGGDEPLKQRSILPMKDKTSPSQPLAPYFSLFPPRHLTPYSSLQGPSASYPSSSSSPSRPPLTSPSNGT